MRQFHNFNFTIFVFLQRYRVQLVKEKKERETRREDKGAEGKKKLFSLSQQPFSPQ